MVTLIDVPTYKLWKKCVFGNIMLKNCQPQPWGKANQVSTKLGFQVSTGG